LNRLTKQQENKYKQLNTNIMTTAMNNTKAIIALTEKFLNNEITNEDFNTQVLILEKV
jgi:hypothetical protein